MSLLRSGYYGASWVGTPLIYAYLRWRASRGYEEATRLPERRGIASSPRPNKPLLWIHAVSVGEAVAALTIMQSILNKFPNIQGLLTTTTVSSANVVQKRLTGSIIHQYCPVDVPIAVNRFLNHWQPDLAIWIESELWPNLMYATQELGTPTILLNGRMSVKSFSSWKYAKGMIASLLGRLSLCAVQSQAQADLFAKLGVPNVSVMGNAKLLMTPLEVNPEKYAVLKNKIGNRPVWLAASTHPGEEDLIFKTHKLLKKDYPDLLTLLVPRHIERSQTLFDLAQQEGLKPTLHTSSPSSEPYDLYIGNTLGEMALFYALAPITVMGATFIPKGGHNPIEAAQLGSFVLHGPHIFKNSQLYDTLSSLGLSKETLHDPVSLAFEVSSWLETSKTSYSEPPALKICREKGLSTLMTLLDPYLKTLREDRG